MKNLSKSDFKRVFDQKGYSLFEKDAKQYNINLIGVRKDSSVPNSFDDVFFILWKYMGHWNRLVHDGTTDTGKYYLNHPLSKMGTAILKPDQYLGTWKLGKHQNKYEALVQRKKVTVLRDPNKDNVLDFDSAIEETGFFGINHHRANAYKRSIQVGKWSAGCQVRANPLEYDIFIKVCKLSAQNWGNSFSYTLLEEKDF